MRNKTQFDKSFVHIFTDKTPSEIDPFENMASFEMFADFSGMGMHSELSFSSMFVPNEKMPHPDYRAESNESNQKGNTNSNKRKSTFMSQLNVTENHHKCSKIYDQYTTGPISSIISDYSPDWSFVEGGVKVLITGTWTHVEYSHTNSTSNQANRSIYTVLFDSVPVLTTLVQSGVLRCFSPPHDVGIAIVEVAYGGVIISNAVTFEFKSFRTPLTESTTTSNTSSLTSNILSNRSDNIVFCSSLCIRLDAVYEWMYTREDSEVRNRLSTHSSMVDLDNMEDLIVTHCRKMILKNGRSSTIETWDMLGYRGMTLLHLAAALGYSKLVCVMIAWRTENPNAILDTEIDALSQDYDGYTPLTWALALGHTETARILYRWNKTAMNVRNNIFQTPLEVCALGGFDNLVAEFKSFETESDKLMKDAIDEICLVKPNMLTNIDNKDLGDDHVSSNAADHKSKDSSSQ